MAAGFILKADYNSLGRIMVHEMHTEDKIDVLLLGDSHLRKAINIPLIEEYSNKKVFSASSSNQEIDTSYALLQECYTFHPELKEVYVSLDYFYTYIGDFKDRTKMNNIYNISDYLKNKKVKYDFLFNATSPKYYINHVLQFNKDKVSFNSRKIVLNLQSLITGNYWKYPYPESEDEIYLGKGCCVSYEKLDSPIIMEADIVSFEEEKISRDYINTINKIIAFCKKNNLKVTFLTIPEELFSIYSIQNYDSFASCLKEQVNNPLFEYYDFNYTKKEFLNLSISDFYDNEHQNYDGSVKTTAFFNQFISSPAEKRQNFFYNSLNEKSLAMEDLFCGIYYELSESKDSLIIYPVYNYYKNSTLSFDYYLYANTEKIPLLLNTESNIVELPESTEGLINVIIRMNDKQVLDFDYSFNTLWMKN